MPDQDFSPRAARHLRGFGRRRVEDDTVDDERAPNPPSTTEPEPDPQPRLRETPAPDTSLTPGSIWGPQLTATQAPAEPRPPADPPPPPSPPSQTTPPQSPPPQSPPPQSPPPPPSGPPRSPAPPATPDNPQASAERPNPKQRRRAGEQAADPESVDIAAEDSHAWWAQRDDLDRLVNPKKRGAAARAQRAAREAFAPAGATNVAANAYAQPEGHPYSWDPASVYTWASEGEAVADEVAPLIAGEATPWDVLGLTSEATWDEVLKQHRRLAKQHHPDRHAADGGASRAEAEARMAEINAAFGDLRRIYRLTDGI